MNCAIIVCVTINSLLHKHWCNRNPPNKFAKLIPTPPKHLKIMHNPPSLAHRRHKVGWLGNTSHHVHPVRGTLRWRGVRWPLMGAAAAAMAAGRPGLGWWRPGRWLCGGGDGRWGRRWCWQRREILLQQCGDQASRLFIHTIVPRCREGCCWPPPPLSGAVAPLRSPHRRAVGLLLPAVPRGLQRWSWPVVGVDVTQSQVGQDDQCVSSTILIAILTTRPNKRTHRAPLCTLGCLQRFLGLVGGGVKQFQVHCEDRDGQFTHTRSLGVHN